VDYFAGSFLGVEIQRDRHILPQSHNRRSYRIQILYQNTWPSHFLVYISFFPIQLYLYFSLSLTFSFPVHHTFSILLNFHAQTYKVFYYGTEREQTCR
jgi:hypothetical protein